MRHGIRICNIRLGSTVPIIYIVLHTYDFSYNLDTKLLYFDRLICSSGFLILSTGLLLPLTNFQHEVGAGSRPAVWSVRQYTTNKKFSLLARYLKSKETVRINAIE